LRAAASTNANLEDIISSLKDDIAQKTAALERANEKEASLAREIARLEKQLADKDQAHTMRAGDLEKQILKSSAQTSKVRSRACNASFIVKLSRLQRHAGNRTRNSATLSTRWTSKRPLPHRQSNSVAKKLI